MPRVSQAVILAGGEGSRLGPITRYRPKPMVPVANRSVLDYVVEALLDVNIDDITVVIGYRGDRIRDHLEHKYPDVGFTYVAQEKQLGTGHAVRQAEETVKGEFLLINGDTIVNSALLKDTLNQHSNDQVTASTAVVESNRPGDYGVIDTENGHIVGITENPSESMGFLINAGVYILPAKIFDAVKAIDARNGEYYVTDALIELAEPVRSIDVGGVWLDPSYPWDILVVTEAILSSHRELLAESSESGNHVHVAESATLHPSSIVEPPAIIGPDCEVTAGSVVRNATCLGPNTKVGPQSVVDRTVTGMDTQVGSQVTLRDTVVGDGATIADGVTFGGGPGDVAINGHIYRDRPIGGIVADRASIGEGVVVEAGVQIGPHATVSPGSTIRSDVSAKTEVRG